MKIQDFTKGDIGRQVTYIPFEGCDPELHQFGVITSFNDTNIFVRYGSDERSQATRPEDLSWR